MRLQPDEEYREPPVNPYRRETSPGPQYSTRTRCDLCEETRRCFTNHGLTACVGCHEDLLPGEGVW